MVTETLGVMVRKKLIDYMVHTSTSVRDINELVERYINRNEGWEIVGPCTPAVRASGTVFYCQTLARYEYIEERTDDM